MPRLTDLSDASSPARSVLDPPNQDRARHLQGVDRRIFELAFLDNLPQSAIARVLGMPRSTLHRRLRRILARLRSPEAGIVLDRHFPICDSTRAIAVLHWIAGLTVRQIAAQRGVSVHTVRTAIANVRSRCEAFRALQRKFSRTLASLP